MESESRNLGSVVYFGVLSIVFAEVFSGSAPLWFLDPWGIFVVFPLYWLHGLILLNLALRFHRSSPIQLYLWGIIYGLYESWMTKVIWAGYMGEDSPQFGTFLGFAVGEFLVIALFWHAIFSFIIPIFVFEISALNENGDSKWTQIIPSHGKFLVKNKKNEILFILAFILGATMIAAGLNTELVPVIIAILGNILLVVLTYFLAKRLSNGEMSIQQLRLGKKGMTLAALYLSFLYIFMWFVLLPERIPGIETILLTIGFYILVLFLIWLGPKDTELEEGERGITMRRMWLLFGTFSVLAIAWCFLSELAIIIGILMYLAMVILGPLIFLSVIIIITRLRLRNHVFDTPEEVR
ncbi:MAG: conserved membrane protein of unknown function [Candidatus Thorarchaeota archaeon]|nr:MAG: conserved membrane protein of unknown function [Candidatus Thorarchaeota archaeon]